MPVGTSGTADPSQSYNYSYGYGTDPAYYSGFTGYGATATAQATTGSEIDPNTQYYSNQMLPAAPYSEYKKD